MTELKDINDDKYDMLTHKNVKFLFNQFNNHVTQINEPVKYRKHIEIVDEDFALCVLQEENLPYFIEWLFEVCTNHEFENIVGSGNPEEVKIINDVLPNLPIYDGLYKNIHKSVADNLHEYFNHIPEEKLKKIDKDLRLDYFFIEFNNQYNSRGIIHTYSWFYY